MKPAGLDRGAIAVIAAVAAALAGFAFAIGGAIDISRTGGVLTIVVLATTVAFGRAAWSGRLPRPFAGSSPLMLMALLAALAAISIGWSILPGDSYVDATLMIAYTAILAGGALAAQLLPGRTREITGGLMLAALLICLFGLLSRVHPVWFSETDAYARVRMPFEYWNAVGSVAVFGLISALWLGTVRDLGKWPVALSYPAGGVFFVTLTLSQSRGALFVALLTLALWLLLAPRRLRSAWWLAAVAAVAAPVVAWAWGQPALSQDFVALAQRSNTGDAFGLILLSMIAVLAGLGYATERMRRDRSLSPGRRYATGRVLLVALAISPFVFAGIVGAGSDQGLGKISSGVSDLFDANKTAPSNSPGRLTQTSSLRARYWRDAFKIFSDNSLHGTGADTYSAARLPYRRDTIKVRHAHGFVPQTLSDLGIYGLILLLALAVAWFIAMARAAGATARAPHRWLENAGDARVANLTIALVAFAFGAHSAIDWTWYVPGVAAFGLVAAGW
ncbi:MAG: O-antigen ligase family protein, partial [Thermoleophilia bacterium]|nr:O-antigen ligase family protein [Thermoleophilia bacterium]